MIVYTAWFFASLALGAFGVLFARNFARKKDWLDHPNERSFHDRPTPRIGGIGMLLPVIAGLLVFLALPQDLLTTEPVLLLVPAFLIALLSYFDDRFELPRMVRFSGHTICAGLVLWLFHEAWVAQPLPLLGSMLPVAACAVLLLVWIAGLTNAYNFMDGIDGIAAVQGLLVIIGWGGILLVNAPRIPEQADAQFLLLLTLAGGLLGFLILNWAPASVFMGDIGSTFLGFYFASLPFAAVQIGIPFDRAVEAGVLFVWPFVMDTSVTFVRRAIRRENVFKAHRSHLYQHLAATFESRETGHRVTSLVFGLLSLVGLLLFWTPGPVWAKAAVLVWLWLAVTAWTYGLRPKPVKANKRWTEFKSSSEYLINEKSDFLQMPFEIYLSPPEVTEAEKRNVLEAFESGFIAPVGPQIASFERELAGYLGLPSIQALSSGTAAIHLGLRALGVGPGDCVLCPDLTFIASVNPVRYLGAEPVLVDVVKDTWAIDPELAREAIRTLRREHRTVRAMVVVHAFGVPAPMEELMRISREEGVPVLEDCAGAFGSRYKDHSVGTFGDAAAFSFNGNKVLTTSGGGAVFIKDLDLRVTARSWANQGKAPDSVGYTHETLGYNYKLSNICAAIGLGQLETISDRLARKADIFRDYKTRFAGLNGVSFMPEPDYGRNNYWLTSVGVGTQTVAEQVVTSLRSQGIEAAPMWKPMHMQGLNRDLRYFGGHVSKEIHETFISLPSGSSLTPEQIQRICDLVRQQLKPV